MGIGNTTAAAALSGRAVRRRPSLCRDWHRRRRGRLGAKACGHHGGARTAIGMCSTIRCAVAASLGGRELAAMLGACLAARHRSHPRAARWLRVDAAVAPLKALRADALDHALSGHMSAEAGHRLLLDELSLNAAARSRHAARRRLGRRRRGAGAARGRSPAIPAWRHSKKRTSPTSRPSGSRARRSRGRTCR